VPLHQDGKLMEGCMNVKLDDVTTSSIKIARQAIGSGALSTTPMLIFVDKWINVAPPNQQC
jgi:predicted secreted hydrolase